MNSGTSRHRRTRRTTVTLEADVADFIKDALSKDKALKEKNLINKLLRAGIKVESKPRSTVFKVKAFKTSLAENVTADGVELLLDEI